MSLSKGAASTRAEESDEEAPETMIAVEEVLAKKHTMKIAKEKNRLSFGASAFEDESVITIRPKLAVKRVP